MRKSQIVQPALLLLIFVVKVLSQNSAAADQDLAQKPNTPIEETDRPEQGQATLVTRDPFQLPPLLQEILRQKEAAKAAAQSAGK